MATEVELVRSLHEAIEVDDVDAALELVHPDVDWHPGAFVTGRRRYRGRAGVLAWFKEKARIAHVLHEQIRVHWTHYDPLDGSVLAAGHVRIIRAESMFGTDFADVYEVDQSNLIRALTWYPSPASARIALRR